jgi:thiamine phosphate synthase YjbQ (UPF0047 family)
MDTEVIDVDTARTRIVDLTDEVRAFCRDRRDGLCNVFVPHATAGVAIIETGAGSDDDMAVRWSGCCLETTVTAIPMVHLGMAPITCFRAWCRRR